MRNFAIVISITVVFADYVTIATTVLDAQVAQAVLNVFPVFIAKAAFTAVIATGSKGTKELKIIRLNIFSLVFS